MNGKARLSSLLELLLKMFTWLWVKVWVLRTCMPFITQALHILAFFAFVYFLALAFILNSSYFLIKWHNTTMHMMYVCVCMPVCVHERERERWVDDHCFTRSFGSIVFCVFFNLLPKQVIMKTIIWQSVIINSVGVLSRH